MIELIDEATGQAIGLFVHHQTNDAVNDQTCLKTA